jgi:hypothetical protein
MSEKPKSQHLSRKAILYVGQSWGTRSGTKWRARSCNTRCGSG